MRSGDVLSAMMRDEGLELARLSKAFANDRCSRCRVARPAAFSQAPLLFLATS